MPDFQPPKEKSITRSSMNARLQTAEHILFRILIDRYGAKPKSVRYDKDKCSLDVNTERDLREINKKEIEEAVNSIISKNLAVNKYALPRKDAEKIVDVSLVPENINNIRIVEIVGFDKEACAGNHVDSTKEIGGIEITAIERNGKDTYKVYFTLKSGEKMKRIKSKKMKFQPPKGMKDIMPEEMAKRKRMYEKIRNVLDSRGYRELEPSALEDFKTLSAKSGEDIKNEIYCFRDKGGRELGLRFDLTVGLARIAATSPITFPWKAYCISEMWRYDNPQFGRFRSFWQWDIEIFGSSQIAADAEIIAAGVEILKSLGLSDFEVRISDRMIVEGILEFLGVKKPQIEDAMRTIDKVFKLTRKQLIDEFKKSGIAPVQAAEILNAVSRKGEPKQVLSKMTADFPNNEKINLRILELQKLFEALEALGVYDLCRLDLSVVRGLGYYTGIVFEAVDPKTPELGSLFGGGRYDSLAGIYGRSMPACGVAGGIERTMAALQKRGISPEKQECTEYFVAAVNDSVRGEALKIAQKLRSEGKPAEFDIMGKNLRGQLEYANRIGAKKAVIVGPKELAEGKVRIRDLKSGEEKECRIEDL